ncbi:MAG TPA: 5,6-dimethylbenzimidazole synthase [Halieaceae bacterium]|nr:5,6-dimethylbenzimidazole synthase [Halieaceae bacterium]
MQGFYETLFNRRDVRGEFRSDPIPDDILAKLLIAAHHAPSVGLSQPWNFILVQDVGVKAAVHEAFCEANGEAVAMFPEEKQGLYRQLKLQGILDAPLNLCITCDRKRGGDVVLGRTHQRDMDVYSTVCAVQNLWLAARAENVGVGWVSIITAEKLGSILKLPDHVIPIAYLCLGYVKFFREQPELEEKGWENRRPVEELVYTDQWGSRSGEQALFKVLAAQRDWPQQFIPGEISATDKT